MASQPTQKKSTQRRKKAAVLGVAGIVGLGAAATMANWTDEQFAGAEMTAGDFDLEIAITADGAIPGPKDWKTDTTVDSKNLKIKTGPWGPGESDASDVHIRLAEGTTHAAQLTSSRSVKGNSDDWEISGPDSVDQILSIGEDQFVTFPVTVAMSDQVPSAAQGKNASVVWTFTAESLPN